MSRLMVSLSFVMVGLVGCAFTPGEAGDPMNPIPPIFTGAGASSGTGSTGGGGSGSTPDANCGVIQQTPTRVQPDVLIVLDASGSMNDDINNAQCSNGCGATSKWAQM